MQLPFAQQLKKIKLKYVVAVALLLLLLIGGGVAMYLSTRPQDTRQQASQGFEYSVIDGEFIDELGDDCSVTSYNARCVSGPTGRSGVYCDGFTKTVKSTTCADGEVCSINTGRVVCKSADAKACVGGVADGSAACYGSTRYWFCSNGNFDRSTLVYCPSGTLCSDGKCISTTPGANCAGPSGQVQHGSSVCFTSTQYANCVNGKLSPTQTCENGDTCSSATGRCESSNNGETGTGGVNPPITGGGACRSSGQSCDNGSNLCCSGNVCQGTNNARVCQPFTGDVCGANATCGGAGGWLGFQCSQLTNTNGEGLQCLENPQTFNNYQDAYNYASQNGCGQVDEVCVGGSKNRQLCGGFQIINTNCGGDTPPPVITPPPVPSVSPSATPTATPTPTPSPTPSPSPSPIPPVCGTTCNFTSECPQNHTCTGNRCILTACANGVGCTSDGCQMTSCGSTCASSTECPQDLTCSGGRCVLPVCVAGYSCSSDMCRTTACTSACTTSAECPSNNTCSNGTCILTACASGATCDANRCNVLQPSPVPSPVIGCNDSCVTNSDCRASNHICVDTTSGRRCRLDSNITSEYCLPLGQAPTQPATPTALPVAGSNDIIRAMGIGAAALIMGVVGLLLL